MKLQMSKSLRDSFIRRQCANVLSNRGSPTTDTSIAIPQTTEPQIVKKILVQLWRQIDEEIVKDTILTAFGLIMSTILRTRRRESSNQASSNRGWQLEVSFSAEASSKGTSERADREEP
jgi:hypothetical protein